MPSETRFGRAQLRSTSGVLLCLRQPWIRVRIAASLLDARQERDWVMWLGLRAA